MSKNEDKKTKKTNKHNNPKHNPAKRRRKVVNKKNTQPKQPLPYKRGSLMQAMNGLLRKKGIQNVSYDEALALAKRIKPDTKFNHYHLAWYKNNLKNVLYDEQHALAVQIKQEAKAS